MNFIDRLAPETLCHILNIAADCDPAHPARANLIVDIGDGLDDDYDEEDERLVDGDGDITQSGDVGGAVRYSHVSRHWRSTALANRTMWTEVGVLPHAFETLVLRAGERAKLRLKFHGSFRRQDFGIAVSYLVAHPSVARRVISLEIYEHRRNAFSRATFLSLSRCAFDGIRDLHVVGNECDLLLSGALKLFDAFSLPSLCCATLTDVVFVFPQSTGLKTLIMAARDTEDGIEPYTVHLRLLLPSLALYRDTLQVLRLGSLGYDPTDLDMAQDERIHLPKLRILQYMDRLEQAGPPDPNAVAPFFEHITLNKNVLIVLYLHFCRPESPLSMTGTVDALRSAGMLPIFGVHVQVSPNELPVLRFYTSPSQDIQRYETDKELLDATFGLQDKETREEWHEEEDDEEMDETQNSEQGEDTEGIDMGESEDRGSFLICKIYVSYNKSKLTRDIVLSRALGALPTVGALEVCAVDAYVYEGIRQTFPANVASRWVPLILSDEIHV